MGFLGSIFYELLYGINTVVNNYVLAIILFTLIIKVIMIPLDYKQRKQSFMLKKLQPEMDSIKKRYGHDMKKYQQKIQELQKGAGYSALGGCLPMLLILPIFAGLYGAVQIMQKEQVAQMILNIHNGITDPNQLLVSFGWIRNIWAPDSMLMTALPSMVDINNVAGFTGPTHLLTADMLEQARQIASSLSGNEAALQEFLYTVGTEPTWGITGALTLAAASNGMFILPAIGGLAAFFSQRISMKAMPANDQTNSMMKMMTWMMPLITVYIGATSSAAFSFYWITSMLFSFVEQLIFQAYFKKKDEKAEELSTYGGTE